MDYRPAFFCPACLQYLKGGGFRLGGVHFKRPLIPEPRIDPLPAVSASGNTSLAGNIAGLVRPLYEPLNAGQKKGPQFGALQYRI